MHQVVTDPVAHLDFEFARACDVRLWAGVDWDPCPGRAEWWARHRCCGRVALICAPHRGDDEEYECIGCGRLFHPLTDAEWGRL